MFPPSRIVCLTEETVETLYLLGEQHRIVGISGYVVRPPQAPNRPHLDFNALVLSLGSSALIHLGEAPDPVNGKTQEPDLVLAFSDLQSDIVAELIRRGIAVHAFNQRTIAGILDMIRMLGAIVDAAARAAQLAGELVGRLTDARARSRELLRRPKIFFEEWDEPLISGIGWVSELIEAAGGLDIFADRSRSPAAKGRIVTAAEVGARQPDIIIGSWCGKKFRPERVRARSGFEDVPAVLDDAIHEIKSPLILQPGPAALTDGLAALQAIIEGWAATHA